MVDLSIRIVSVAVACVMGLLLLTTFYTHHHLDLQHHHQSKAADPNVVSIHSVATPEESLIEDLWPDDGSD